MFKNYLALAGVAYLVAESSHKLKGHGFNWSGHMPGLWGRSQ